MRQNHNEYNVRIVILFAMHKYVCIFYHAYMFLNTTGPEKQRLSVVDIKVYLDKSFQSAI